MKGCKELEELREQYDSLKEEYDNAIGHIQKAKAFNEAIENIRIADDIMLILSVAKKLKGLLYAFSAIYAGLYVSAILHPQYFSDVFFLVGAVIMFGIMAVIHLYPKTDELHKALIARKLERMKTGWHEWKS